MSAYSTLSVSRKLAIRCIQDLLYNASNDQLGDMLYDLLKDTACYNYAVERYGNEDDSTLESIVDGVI